MDFYENFNSDHQVTEHFHEFAMGIQADDEGNFYYAKSACHARKPKVPQHGTLLKVSADGSKTEILANGFRAANGVCRNPDGSFFVTDQQGHWTPMNRINKVSLNNNLFSGVDATFTSSNLLVMVPVLSSAAKIPFPSLKILRTILFNSDIYFVCLNITLRLCIMIKIIIKYCCSNMN